MENWKLDGHKLMFHPKRVEEWLRTGDNYPIYIEISLVNKCNYRCGFCAFDYTEYLGNKLESNKLKKAISEMAECDVKSIVFAGTGEPLMHPDLAELVKHSVDCGIDVGLSTNGALLNAKIIEVLVDNLRWIRISFNAGSPETYGIVHGCAPEMFHKVKSNIAGIIACKKRKASNITIGVQSLILSETKDEYLAMAEEMKKLEVDYFSLKPFSPHPDSLHSTMNDSKSLLSDDIIAKIRALSDDNFQAIIRNRSIESLDNNKKDYNECLGLPFLCYLEADGLVYACNTFVGDKTCTYGNIYEQSFSEIWGSEQRQKVIKRLTGMKKKQCRQACRLDQINKYLWALHNPGAHVNFI